MVCIPGAVTSAFFVAVILLDLYNLESRRVPGHALLGAFAVLLVSFICERTNEGVAWLLILFPFILLAAGYFLRLIFSIDYKSYIYGSNSSESYSYSCPCCNMNPCHCIKPCPAAPVKPAPPPAPAPAPTPTPSCPKSEPVPTCPMPKPPSCPQKPGSCIKGTL